MDDYTKKLCLIISVSKVDWLLTSESVNFTELVTKAEKSTKLVTEELDMTEQDGLLVYWMWMSRSKWKSALTLVKDTVPLQLSRIRYRLAIEK